MGAGPKAAVDLALPGPPRTSSLLRSIRTVEAAASDLRWLNGVSFEAWPCRTGQSTDPCVPEPFDAERGTPSELDALLLRVAYECSTLTSGSFGERALALLTANQSRLVAEAFEAFLQDPAPFSAPAILAATDDPILMLARLEQHLASCTAGGDGIIHASREIVTRWCAAHLIDRDPAGNLFTCVGTLVVADAGYTGGAPLGEATDPDERWAYATSLIDEIRLGPIEAINTDVETVDISLNDKKAWANRGALVLFNPCCRAAIKLGGF